MMVKINRKKQTPSKGTINGSETSHVLGPYTLSGTFDGINLNNFPRVQDDSLIIFTGKEKRGF